MTVRRSGGSSGTGSSIPTVVRTGKVFKVAKDTQVPIGVTVDMEVGSGIDMDENSALVETI